MGHQHALACQMEPDVDLVAGCDTVASQRDAWASAFGIPQSSLYADYDEMLNREPLDVVIVSTHANLHHAPVLAAARRGIHVLCEKPIALTLREADEMVAACAAAGITLSVNHLKRGSRGNDLVRGLLQDGTIGTLYLIRGEAKGRRWAGSELMEMGTHLFDWLRDLAGDPVWLFAHVVQGDHAAGRSDIVHSLDLPYRERDCGLVLGERAFCSLGLAAGLHADIGFLAQPSDQDVGYGFDFCGTEGTLAVRRSVGTEIFLQRGHHRGPLGAQPWERVPVDEAEGLAPPTSAVDKPGIRLACQRRLLRNLLTAIIDEREPSPSGRDGLAALELVMAVWQSQREGRPVTLPLAHREHPLETWLMP
jgi:predicted dehydrogenase